MALSGLKRKKPCTPDAERLDPTAIDAWPQHLPGRFIAFFEAALAEVEVLLGVTWVEDLTDPDTGEIGTLRSATGCAARSCSPTRGLPDRKDPGRAPMAPAHPRVTIGA